MCVCVCVCVCLGKTRHININLFFVKISTILENCRGDFRDFLGLPGPRGGRKRIQGSRLTSEPRGPVSWPLFVFESDTPKNGKRLCLCVLFFLNVCVCVCVCV